MTITTMPLMNAIDNCKKMLWQVPNFQREFVWTNSQVEELIESVLKGYTIGIVTLWAQPPMQRHTQARSISLVNGTNNSFYFDQQEQVQSCLTQTSYGIDYINDPINAANLPQVSLIIDGRQRMTALSLVFSHFKCTNARRTFSGGWFINFASCASNGTEPSDNIKYFKASEIASLGLNSIAGCIQNGYFPLRDVNKIAQSYIGQIHNPAMYPGQVVPPDANQRVNVLGSIQNVLTSTNIPIGEIPHSIGLNQICEIFKVLNQTGTKVSVFDLIHNILYGNSSGSFDLRGTVKSLNYLTNISSLISESREDYFCQIVTGFTAGSQLITTPGQLYTLKSSDLLSTTLQNYRDFFSNINLIEQWLGDLYSLVYDSYVPSDIKEISYPASIIIYISLRWRLHSSANSPYSVNQLNNLFSAFYWRNLLNQRYDQGFLTKFKNDLKNIDDFLSSSEIKYQSNISAWSTNLDIWFKANGMDKVNAIELKSICLDDSLRGAMAQAITLLMKGQLKHSIVTNNAFNNPRDKVQMHHIFPKNWIKNNAKTLPSVVSNGDSHFSNLIPLDAISNVNWSASVPGQYIVSNRMSHSHYFVDAFIDLQCYTYLIQNDITSFWDRRSDLIAQKLLTLQG